MRISIGAGLFLGAVCFAFARQSQAAPGAGAYQAFTFKGVRYGIFQANPTAVSLHWRDDKGKDYRRLYNLKQDLEKHGRKVELLMNAGIYDKDNTPAGLWIEHGQVLKALNTRKGQGNFYLRPNGVFFLDKTGAKILPTQQYRRGHYRPRYAVQSGPMILINGRINSRFIKGLSSPYKRNAVCTKKDGTLYFLMTESYDSGSEWPGFYRLGQALQSIGCYQALYLDGAISAWYIPDISSFFHWKSFTGMIAVTRRSEK